MAAYTYSDSDFRFSSTWTPDDIKMIARDVRLKVITDELKFTIDKSKLRDMPLSIVKDKYPNAIISGSACLRAFGLIDRESKDFDLIVDKKPNIELFKNRFDGEQFLNDTRLGSANIDRYTNKNLGLISFFKKLITPTKLVNVDFFLNNGDAEYQEFEYEGFTYKFHNPLQIFDKKCLMASTESKKRGSYFSNSIDKHLLDIVRISEKIKSL